MANKLKLAGYDTHAVGKWDCGCAIVESTPLGRGYDDWIGYYQHAEPRITKKMPRYRALERLIIV